MAVWVFGVPLTHTKQCRRSKMQPEREAPKPFIMQKNTRKDHTDEEWGRDGVKQTNRNQVMAISGFGVPLTHKTVQKVQNAAKTSHPKAIYTA